MKDKNKILLREFLLSFWKVHILHHAGEGPLVGQWMLSELREHGYDVSPGTLYPLLRRMVAYGWLTGKSDPKAGARARKEYYLTKEGRRILDQLREHIFEMHREINPKTGPGKKHR
ncbi:MAG: helix-turn-helix transcriptional regulator [Candidatus Hydrogenedentes bacterium]|nr:helix-turn-helix transcriptional regulator [Candidatus Hydrogenedentota bacterium]